MRTNGLVRKVMAVAIVSAFFLAACGGDDPTQDAGAGDGATEAPAEEEPLRVALLLPGKADDFGYSQLGADALKLIEEELGAETTYAEEVAVDQQVEVFRDFANQGYDLIAGWGGQWDDGASTVAEEFPDQAFTVFNGEGSNGTNYASSNLNVEQWEWLVGYIDATVSKTGVVGQIAGPCFQSTAFLVHGFEQGAQVAADELGKDVEVKTVGLESFDDPAAAKEAALALIDEGADVLHVGLNTGNLGVFEAAKERDVLVTTEFFDQSAEAPKHILTSSLMPSPKALLAAAQAVADGTFDGNPIYVPITADEEALSGFNGLAPNSLYDRAKELQAEIASEELAIEADGSCPY